METYKKGLSAARQFMDAGFYYDNLYRMAQACRDEADPNRLMTAFALHAIFTDLARQMGDKPILASSTRKLEAKYRTLINLALEKAISGASIEEQHGRLLEVIQVYWEDDPLE